MWYHDKTNTYIGIGTDFILNGIKYPSNWLQLATENDILEIGLLPVTTIGTRGDDKYFDNKEVMSNGVIQITSTLKPISSLFLIAEVATQLAMDMFAGTWGYGHPPGSTGSIDQGISYIDDPNILWNNEAIALKNYRSQVWTWFVAKEASITANTLPRPVNIEDFLIDMPSPPKRPTS